MPVKLQMTDVTRCEIPDDRTYNKVMFIEHDGMQSDSMSMYQHTILMPCEYSKPLFLDGQCLNHSLSFKIVINQYLIYSSGVHIPEKQ